MKTRYLIAVTIVLLAAGTWWYLSEHEEARYRQEVLAKIAGLLLDWEKAQLDLINERLKPISTSYDSPSFAAEWDERLKERKDIEQRRSEIAKAFVVLERSVRERSRGEVHAWLKDDRAWRALDKEIQP